MSLWDAWLHLHLVATLWLTVASLFVAWRNERWAVVSWLSSALPFFLGLLSIGIKLGWVSEMLAIAFVWLAGWALLRLLFPLQVALAAIAAWELLGVSLLLTAAAQPFLKPHYIPRQTLCILTGLVLIFFACSRPQALSALFGPKGVQAALWCVFLSLALFRFFPVGSAAALMGAWLLGVSIIVARTACSIGVPANLAQWWQKWRWALIMAALPTAVLLLFRDLSPAFVFLVILIGAFEAFGQRRAAFWLTALGLTIPTLGYFLGVPSLLVERVHALLSPSMARSSQHLEALWAIARGGLWGRGLAHFATLSDQGVLCACQAVAFARRARPALSLPVTDNILAFAAETLGVVGLLALLGLAAFVAFGFWEEAQKATDYRARAWFLTIFLAWAFSYLIVAAWTACRWPIMGLAVPLLTASVFHTTLWFFVFALSLAFVLSSPTTSFTPLPPLRSIFAPIVTIFASIIIAVSFAFHATFSRVTILQTCFVDLETERLCRQAIWHGWVTFVDGHLQVNDTRLPPHLPPRRRERLRSFLNRQIQRGVFQVRNGQVILNPNASFVRIEPLYGGILSLVGGDER
jgi:cell division protein FtsW (lipid II flippase)